MAQRIILNTKKPTEQGTNWPEEPDVKILDGQPSRRISRGLYNEHSELRNCEEDK